MNEKTETKLALHMLHHKEHGYSALYILRKSAIRYLLLLIIFALGGALISQEGDSLLLIIGIFIGSVARDFGWMRQGKRAWPLYMKVIDWVKVKEIAKQSLHPIADSARSE